MRRLGCLLAVVTAIAGCASGSAGAAVGETTNLGLVGYWPLDEGQGSRAANLASMGGNLLGSTGDTVVRDAAWTTGRFGGGMHFDRGGRGLTVSPFRELDCQQAVTIAAWVRLDEGRQANAFIWTRERAYRLGLDPQGQGRLRFQLALDGKWAGNWLLGRTPLQPGQWTYVAGVYDGAERRVYVDGRLDAQAPATGGISRGDQATIGQDFGGAVDEVRVWGRALSADELARAMAQDAAQMRATMVPADALRFYPVHCVGMLGQPSTAEVAVFNAAPAPYAAEVSVELLSPNGKTLAANPQRISVPAHDKARVRLPFSPNEAGRHTLIIRAGGRDLYLMPTFVMAPHPRQPVGALKLQPVAAVDLTQNLGPERLCEDGSSRVVDSPAGRYRECGEARGARFVVRLTLRQPGLHLLRVRYPDDKPRTCEIAACSPDEADLYNVQTGYLTGPPYATSNRFQTLDCVLWARDIHQSVIFTTWEANKPAAAASVEAFEVTGGLPASPVAAVDSPRQIGLYWEDAAPLPWCVGAEGTSFAAFDTAARNLCDLMDYTGANVLFHPAVWYEGPIYDSLVEEDGTLGGRDLPAAGWMEILLRRFQERGFTFYPTFNVHELASLQASGNADVEQVKAGAPTCNAVTSDGQMKSRTWHNQPPAYNALHPQVQARVLALVQELVDRYGASPAFGAVAFHLTRCQLLQLGGLDSSYDDWTLGQFEHDTGVKVPAAANDPDRFGKRCDWLLAHVRERWIQWRCQRLADYYGTVAQVLRKRRADLKLVAAVLNPLPVVDAPRWAQGTRLADLSREAGIDPALIGRQPGVVVVKHLGPSDYRFRVATSPPGSEQAALPLRGMDFADDQLRDYRVTPDFGVFLYNRYFESSSRQRQTLRCSWYSDPGWLASAIVPGAGHFMEYYAHAMAALDPALITIGGFTLGTVGHEAQVARFADVFRRLPVGTWEEVPSGGSQVVARTLLVHGARYLYAVNLSDAPGKLTLPAGLVADAAPLGASPAPVRTDQGWTAELAPYQLAAWTKATHLR